jgi:hypothetical protein
VLHVFHSHVVYRGNRNTIYQHIQIHTYILTAIVYTVCVYIYIHI